MGAKGKRPMLRNISREMVEYFRSTIKIVDLIGVMDMAVIAQAASACVARNPGPAPPWTSPQEVPMIQGCIPEKMVSDPAGYFVVYVDRSKRKLSLEHYHNSGVLDVIIEGATASEMYMPAIERQLLSRLDHAAYLGRELARAERSLDTGEPYIQDAAPEKQTPIPHGNEPKAETSACGCNSNCKERKL